jgi:hypothetical protein
MRGKRLAGRRTELSDLQSDRGVSPGSCFQLTLTRDALVVRLDHTRYLIFKLAATLWHSFDNNIRPVRRVESAYEKQSLTDFEFVLGHKRCRRTRNLYVESILTPKMKRDAAVHPSSRLAPPPQWPYEGDNGIKKPSTFPSAD